MAGCGAAESPLSTGKIGFTHFPRRTGLRFAGKCFADSPMKARVTVTLKSGILDPQGKAIEGALASLGISGVSSVRQGKVFDIEIADGDRAGVEARLRDAAEKLLANTVIENYHIAVIG